MVVQNRLEQLRKRQRDEAVQAQQELLAGVGRRGPAPDSRNWGGDMQAEVVMANPDDEQAMPDAADDAEPYQREMSPEVFSLSALPPEERQIEVIEELEDLRRLVSSLIVCLRSLAIYNCL